MFFGTIWLIENQYEITYEKINAKFTFEIYQALLLNLIAVLIRIHVYFPA